MKTKKKKPNKRQRSAKDEGGSSKRRELFLKISFFAIVFVAIFVMLPKSKYFKYEYELGKPWHYPDLYAPFDFFIKKSADELQQDHKKSVQSIIPFYAVDSVKTEKLVKRLDDIIEKELPKITKRDKKYLKNRIQHIYHKGVIDEDIAFQKPHDYILYIDDGNTVQMMSISSYFTLKQAQKIVLDLLSPLLPDNIALEIVHSIIQANILPDKEKNNLAFNQAIAGISENKNIVKKGSLIVSTHQPISPPTYLKLNTLKSIYKNTDKDNSSTAIKIGQFLFAFVIYVMFVLFTYLYRKPLFKNHRLLFGLFMIFALTIAVFSIVNKYRPEYANYIPFALLPIILKILFDARLALNTLLFFLLFTSVYATHGLEYVIYHLVAGIVAVYCVQNIERRAQFFYVAFILLFTHSLILVALTLLQGLSFDARTLQQFEGFVVSSILTLFAYPIIYLFEKLFGIASEFTLLEISNTNSHLLKRLSIKAPGTFHHSLMVANLAEAAINKIGGNSTLVRAGALYHDIGKIENSEYFIENLSSQSESPHAKISDEKSAKIIIEHVNNGVILAKKENLPESVIDFIRTHHGTTRLNYFYAHFIKMKGNNPTIQEERFTYPGPKPFSKETAVVMLADSIEASSRLLDSFDYHTVSQHVDEIVADKLSHDQLSDSDLTLKDIETLKVVYKSVLIESNHQRIQYPKIGFQAESPEL